MQRGCHNYPGCVHYFLGGTLWRSPQQSVLESWQKNRYTLYVHKPTLGKPPFLCVTLLTLDPTFPLTGKENTACYTAGFRRAMPLLSTLVFCHDLVTSRHHTPPGFIS